MAVPSEASRAFALLNPPPTPPTLTLTPNAAGTTSSTSIIRVDTDALRVGSDIGDFGISCVVTATGTAPLRFASSLITIPEFASIAAFVAGTETAGYIGGNLYLRLARLVDQALGLTVDATDPLGRTTHASIMVPYAVPDPAPVISLAANRLLGIVRLRIGTNVTLPPDPAHDWQLHVVMQRVLPFPPIPPVSHTFSIASISTIASEAAMPNPVLDPAAFEIRRVDHTGLIIMWARSTMPVRVGVRVTNSAGQTTNVVQVVT